MRKKWQKIKEHPITRQSMQQLKPKKSFWSLLGVAVFFILPEIVAMIWGEDIRAYTQHHLMQPLSLDQEYKYKAIEMLFTEPSFINLAIGVALLVWAFY